MGRRLKELTQDNTKCMVKVNGVTLIERLLTQLDKRSLSKIVIVVGYEGQKLINYINTLDVETPIVYVDNPIYNKTNNIYSLALAKEYLCEEDTLLFESDLIFEDSVIDALTEDPRETLALVDKYEAWMDGTCVELDEDDSIEAFIPGKQFKYSDSDKYYKTVNIYKFSKDFSRSHYVPFLEAYTKALGDNEYYEQVLKVITMLDDPVIKAKRLSGQLWYEIDDIQDLDIATSMFAPDDEKVGLIQSRYGGYWRYPKLLDFCYLANPYFPPQKMLDEIKASFDKIIAQFPSGMNVNSLVAARNFGILRQNIVVGNGAAELIKPLMAAFTGNVGFIRPTFEEYPNRYDKERSVCFTPKNDTFSYDENDLISFFSGKSLEALVIVNPDNPSGNYITKSGILKLINWAKENNIKLVVDESFVDFADEEDGTIIYTDILMANPHLYAIKSISKSYGVPGLRLGVLASGDEALIASMKKDVAIWNINSFAEFFMQIEEKYRKAYASGLNKFKAERARYIAELEKIPNLRLIPTQANYVMAELTGKMSSFELTKRLLLKYEIFIKDLKGKTDGKNYIRLAVRNTADNNKLIEALRKEIK